MQGSINIVAQLINRALAAYFKFATGKLKVDEINKHPDVMHEADKEAKVRVTELGDFAVNLRALFWVADRPTAWGTGTEIRESVKKRFDSEGVEIPFPYRTLVYKKDMGRAG